MTALRVLSSRAAKLAAAGSMLLFSLRAFGELAIAVSPQADDFIMFNGKSAAPIFVETNDDHAVIRAAGDLVEDVQRVTGAKPELASTAGDKTNLLIIGTLGQSRTIDRLAAEGKLETNGVSGALESYVLQTVKNPLPGVERALVIAGSDRRGTIYGIYQLSEMIGVSP